MTAVDAALAAIREQYERNLADWAGYTRTPSDHHLILVEEVGEVASAMQDTWPPAYNQNVMRELVDAGAVVLAMMVECGG